ncbi:MAG TPA: hypothetical protein VMN39_04355, partial [Longimicrobiaceae bacterium]|nr:hypothetical protein [Longimicrobiaceae bacterium]
RLSLFPDHATAGSGRIVAEAIAVDFRDEPVTGAELLFEASQPVDTVIGGEVKEQGEGRYRGTIKTDLAGCWTLTAQDVETRTSIQTCFVAPPGPPERIQLVGETDPRRAEPYDEVVLRARLEDRAGNALDPRRIVCRGRDDATHPMVAVGEEARVRVRAAGYTPVPLVFKDSESEVRESFDVRFSAIWLSDPGPVFAGERFRNRLFLVPAPDRPADHATAEIRFDPELVRFRRFRPARSTAPGFRAKARAEGDLLTVKVTGEVPVTAEDFPAGIEIGEITWECQGEGGFCFSAVARMSPSTPPWEQCPDQKRRSPRRLCLNIIYDAAQPGNKAVGTGIANNIATVIGLNDNVKRCCPVLQMDVRYETIGNILINDAVGADGAVTTYNGPNADFQRLFTALRGMANTVIEANCINMVLIPINAAARGLALPGPPGDSVVDPVTLGTNTGAHEAGHALGLLAHSPDPNNLMYSPTGATTTMLTAEQCRRIQETLGNYSA